MGQNPKVWFVDDMPANLAKFKANHEGHFDVEVFSKPGDVLRRIRNKERPDALLCDVFFYDTVEDAERIERQVEELAALLRVKAIENHLYEPRYAAGIDLMKSIYEYFGGQAPPFPMYAYTSKGPFLLGREEWEKISEYGAEILLKNRVSAHSEEMEIEGDIAIRKAGRSWLGWVNTNTRKLMFAMIPSAFFFVLGTLLRGHF